LISTAFWTQRAATICFTSLARIWGKSQILLQANSPDALGTVRIDTSLLDEPNGRELKSLASVDAKGVACIVPRDMSNNQLAQLKVVALRLKARQEQQ
jgi:hypothetical protein